MNIETKYLKGYLEDRLDMLKKCHRQANDDSSYAIQMLSRIEEIKLVIKEVEMLEKL